MSERVLTKEQAELLREGVSLYFQSDGIGTVRVTARPCNDSGALVVVGASHVCELTHQAIEIELDVTRAEFEALRRDVDLLLDRNGMIPTLPGSVK